MNVYDQAQLLRIQNQVVTFLHQKALSVLEVSNNKRLPQISSKLKKQNQKRNNQKPLSLRSNLFQGELFLSLSSKTSKIFLESLNLEIRKHFQKMLRSNWNGKLLRACLRISVMRLMLSLTYWTVRRPSLSWIWIRTQSSRTFENTEIINFEKWWNNTTHLRKNEGFKRTMFQ